MSACSSLGGIAYLPLKMISSDIPSTLLCGQYSLMYDGMSLMDNGLPSTTVFLSCCRVSSAADDFCKLRPFRRTKV